MNFSILSQQATALKRAARSVDQAFLDSLTHRRAVRREHANAQSDALTAQQMAKRATDKAQLRKALGYSD